MGSVRPGFAVPVPGPKEFAMTTPSPAVTAALTRWRTLLIDLTRRNPLLHLRPTLSSYLEISVPSADAVFERLGRAGKSWHFWQPPRDEEDEATGLPLSNLDAAEQLESKPTELV